MRILLKLIALMAIERIVIVLSKTNIEVMYILMPK